MEAVDFLASEVSRRYGSVKRAKGIFLYTAKGVRLTDMYQEGGRAVLGWGGGSAFTVLKNVLSRGLTGSFFTDFDNRIKKAVCDLLGEKRDVCLFPSFADALANALSLSKDSTCVWRPWAKNSDLAVKSDCVIIEPPYPWSSGVTILAYRQGLEPFGKMPDSIRLPAVFSASIARSIYDLKATLAEREEKDWFIYDPVITKYWRREGPWLFPKVSEDKYTDFVLHCLDCQLVISPVYTKPSLIPYKADKGVFSKLKNNPFDM